MMAYKIKKSKSLFELPKEKESELYEEKESEKEHIQEINDDLYADQVPIQVKDKYTLIVEANGQKHKITRKDVGEYHRKYSLEDGSEEHPITDYRTLGSINGEKSYMDDIHKECNSVFSKLDEHNGGFKTLPSDDD